MKKLSILTVSLLFVLCASLAFAGGWGRHQGMGPVGATNLNLTDEQTASLQTLRETYLKEITPLQNELYSKRSELRLLWAKPAPDKAEITAGQNEVFELQRQLQEKTTQYQLDCRNALTPEQQSQMAAVGPGYGRGHGRGWKRW